MAAYAADDIYATAFPTDRGDEFHLACYADIIFAAVYCAEADRGEANII